MTALEFHQIELRYESLRSADPKKEKHLRASLLEHGQQTPVVVIKGEAEDRFVLIDGYKRVRALKKLATDTVEATMWELGEADALLFERLMRMDQEDSALAQGWFLRALIDGFALSARQLSTRLDKSESWVSRRLGLVRALPDAVIELVRTGKVCANAAERFFVPLARAKKEDCLVFAEAVAKGSFSVRQVADLHSGFVSGSEKTRSLVLENPALFLEAQKAAGQAAKKEKSPLEQVLDDLSIVASVCRRIERRLAEPLLRLQTIKNEDSVRESFELAKAIFKKLERTLGDGVSDARSGNENGDLKAA